MSSKFGMRYIKQNHSRSIPRYVMAVDCETVQAHDRKKDDESSHRFRLACSIAGRVSRNGISGIIEQDHHDQHSFWQALRDRTGPRHTLWLVGTKILFDLKVLGFQEYMAKRILLLDSPRSKRDSTCNNGTERKSWVLCVLDSPPTILCLRHAETGGRIIVVDTLNWFKCTVKDLGEACGYPKLDMPESDGSIDDWFNYCRRDTLISFLTFAGLMGWCVKNDMGQFVYTAAGQAMHAYRHRFMLSKIAVHDNQEVKALERAAYFGGRTTVFKRGPIRDTVYQYDVNSLFPYVMAIYSYPCKLVRSEIRARTNIPPDWSRPEDCVANVTVNSKWDFFPLRVDRQVMYPKGRFTTILCGPELGVALRLGAVESVGSWSQYECRDLFSKWVKELYGMRLECREKGNKLYEMFAKCLLNSLYGKFGQLSPVWVHSPDDVSGEPWTTWRGRHPVEGSITEFRSIGEDVFYKDRKRELSSTFVAVAGFVTARARRYMDLLREIAGRDNVLYQGVDSLIVFKEGSRRLTEYGALHETEIGKLKLVCMGNFGEIYGQQDYRIGDKVVIAGRSNYYREIAEGVFSQHRFLNAADLFRPEDRDAIIEKVVTWQRGQRYDPNRYDVDGWIEPLDMMG